MEIFKHKNKEYHYTIEEKDGLWSYMVMYDNDTVVFETALILPLLTEQIIERIENYIVKQRKEKLENLKK